MDYNAIASDFANYKEQCITENVLGYPFALQQLQPLVGKKVLDFGCGSGEFSAILQQAGAHVVGIDQSSDMIKLAQEHHAGIQFYTATNNNLQVFNNNNFDYGVANFVFCTMRHTDQIIEALNSLYRVLKPGGKLVMLHSNWEQSNGKEFISFRLNKTESLISGSIVHATLKSNPNIITSDYFRTRDDYQALFKQAGFRLDKIIEPMAEDDSLEWIDEKEFSPFIIFVAIK